MKKTNEILPLMKDPVKKALEEMVKEERAIYLEEKKDAKANGYYERNLGTPIGILENLKITRTRDGGFSSTPPPYRKRYLVEVGKLVEALLLSCLSTKR